MTFAETACAESKAALAYWRVGNTVDWDDDLLEIKARLPNSWYGPGKLPSPLLKRPRPDAIGSCRKKRPCSCYTCSR